MKKKLKILIILILVCLMLVFVNKSKKNNENGNLSNMGLVQEKDGTVYYNKYEKGIFAVKNGKEKQITDETAYSINIVNDKIYYLTIADFSNVLIKCVDINGENRKTIATIYTSLSKIYVQDENIYYYTNEKENGIAKIDLNGENKSQVISGKIQDFCVAEGKIFYINELNQICSTSISGQNNVILNDQVTAKKIQLVNGWIYYYNELENALFRMKENGKNNELISVLVKNEVYNVCGKYVYYLDQEKSKIARMQIGKSNKCDDIIDVSISKTKINIAGDELYYLDKSQDESQTYQIFRVKIDGKEAEKIIYQ